MYRALGTRAGRARFSGAFNEALRGKGAVVERRGIECATMLNRSSRFFGDSVKRARCEDALDQEGRIGAPAARPRGGPKPGEYVNVRKSGLADQAR